MILSKFACILSSVLLKTVSVLLKHNDFPVLSSVAIGVIASSEHGERVFIPRSGSIWKLFLLKRQSSTTLQNV